MTTRDSEIVVTMARLMFVSAWGDAEAEMGRTYPGQDLYEVAPETPREAITAAEKIAEGIRRENNIDSLHSYYRGMMFMRACEPRVEHTATPRRSYLGYFAACLAWETMGAGVSWEDENPPHGLTVPFVECCGYYSHDAKRHAARDARKAGNARITARLARKH